MQSEQAGEYFLYRLRIKGVQTLLREGITVWVSGPLVDTCNEPKKQWLGR